jgi:hypothetical protein
MKFILNVEPDNLIIGARAAAWMHAHASKKDAILSYGEHSPVVMFVRRNKASISVFQEPDQRQA